MLLFLGALILGLTSSEGGLFENYSSLFVCCIVIPEAFLLLMLLLYLVACAVLD